MFEAFGTLALYSWVSGISAVTAAPFALQLGLLPAFVAMGLVLVGMGLSMSSLASFAEYSPRGEDEGGWFGAFETGDAAL